MYRVSPFTYLINGLLSTGIANTEARCSSLELLTFNAPPGQTCGDYMADYANMTGGSVYNPTSTSTCQYCSVTSTNSFLASVSSYYDDRWTNLGYMYVYIVFNAAAAVGIYWLARVPKKKGVAFYFRGLFSKSRE